MDIIVDIDGTLANIDGTLANIEHRLHFIRKPLLPVIEGTTDVKRADYEAWKAWKPDWDAFFDACDKDTPIIPVCDLVNQLIGDDEHDTGNTIVFVTGRPFRTYAKTTDWLRWNVSYYASKCPLFMRNDGDHRPDDAVKLGILGTLRRQGFDPKLAIDDRQQVVDMWRAEGLICAQVAKGDF